MKNDINRKNKIVILVLIVVIILPFLFTSIKRAFIISTNPDPVIYTHKNSKFKYSIEFNNINELSIRILGPLKTNWLGMQITYHRGELPNVILRTNLNISNIINLTTSKYTKNPLYHSDIKKYGLNSMYIDFVKDTENCTPQLYIFEDGQQIITYQKYNKVYLHVVKDKYKTKETLLK